MTQEKVKQHDFGEQQMESGMSVFISSTYKTSRKKAIEMIDSEKYGLDDSDFWILKNRTRNGEISYTSLIISHNGCLKINEALPEEKKFKSKYLSDIMPSPFGNGMILKYDDETLREYGEVSPSNCRNDYPAAMLLKRVMDRVILKKSGLAFAGVYSEVEADDFSKEANENVTDKPTIDDVYESPKQDIQIKQVRQTKPASSNFSIPMTEKQKRAIIRIREDLGIADEIMNNRIKQITSRDNLDDCTKSEASKVIDWLREQQSIAANNA